MEKSWKAVHVGVPIRGPRINTDHTTHHMTHVEDIAKKLNKLGVMPGEVLIVGDLPGQQTRYLGTRLLVYTAEK